LLLFSSKRLSRHDYDLEVLIEVIVVLTKQLSNIDESLRLALNFAIQSLDVKEELIEAFFT
jgi:hypothetical protein